MPDRDTIERAREDKRQGKAASTQAGEFVKEEMHHIRERKHGARSSKQAIAIGLSKARRAGVKLRVPAKGKASAATRRRAKLDGRRGSRGRPSAKRSAATLRALRREGHEAASKGALARQARQSAKKRGPRAREAAAMKAVRTKGPRARRAAARKAARTRARRGA
jgi:hypothetical protein